MRSLLIPFFIPFLTLVATPAYATNDVYCPAVINCHVTAAGYADKCNNMPSGWNVTSNATNGVSFLQGDYNFNFSAAQSYTNASSNCNYVKASTDTNAKLIVTLSNSSWHAAPGENKWQTNSNQTYCYAQGLWYDQINDPSACPFVMV